MTLTVAITEDVASCLALRRTVFIEEQGVPEADELDGTDVGALHLLAQMNGRPVGTARVVIFGATGKIGRVCVLPEQRGTGLGARLIGACLDLLQTQNGVTRAVLGAQTQALGFYQALGFEPFGAIYDDAGIPHQDMERMI